MNIAGHWVAGVLAVLGLVALGGCVFLAVRDKVVDASVEACEDELLVDRESPEMTSESAVGELRVVGVWPPVAEINGHLCVVMAGVVTAFEEARNRRAANAARDALERLRAHYTETTVTEAEARRLEQAIAAVEAAEGREFLPLPPVEMAVFLNGEVAPFTVNASAIAGVQMLRFRLEASDDADHAGAKFWRDLLRGTAISDSGVQGSLTARLGVSRMADATTIPDAVAQDTFNLRVFGRDAFLLGLAALALLVMSFGVFAWRTTLLRDNKLTAAELRARLVRTRAEVDVVRNDAAKTADERATAERNYQLAERFLGFLGSRNDDSPAGSFSLGRTQMAVWFLLVIAAFLFISMTLGHYRNLISANVLVLLGISGATGLAAIQVTGDKAAERPSKNFFYDILCDADGPQLQRIQSAAWTGVLGGIFAWVAVQDFRLASFDTNLLLLMGIASSLYLGFKFQES